MQKPANHSSHGNKWNINIPRSGSKSPGTAHHVQSILVYELARKLKPYGSISETYGSSFWHDANKI